MPKQKTIKKRKDTLIFLGIILLIDLGFFSAAYFFNQVPMFVLLLLYLVVAIVFWFRQPFKAWTRLLIIIVSFTLCTITGIFLWIVVSALAPWHDHAMYKICLPAIDKYYQSRGEGGRLANESSSNSAWDKNKEGVSRWYVQHEECEQNFWAGKGPVFSENPPGFLPVKTDTKESPTVSSTPKPDNMHSGEGVIEFANIEQGSGAQLVGVKGVGNFAVTNETKIYDENNKQVGFSYLRQGQIVNISGRAGEGYLEALEIKILR